MEHSRVSGFSGLADAPDSPINPKLAQMYRDYAIWANSLGIEPADYDQWRQLTDDSYKMAGVTRK